MRIFRSTSVALCAAGLSLALMAGTPTSTSAAPIGSLAATRAAPASNVDTVRWRKRCYWRHGHLRCHRRHYGYYWGAPGIYLNFGGHHRHHRWHGGRHHRHHGHHRRRH